MEKEKQPRYRIPFEFESQEITAWEQELYDAIEESPFNGAETHFQGFTVLVYKLHQTNLLMFTAAHYGRIPWLQMHIRSEELEDTLWLVPGVINASLLHWEPTYGEKEKVPLGKLA